MSVVYGTKPKHQNEDRQEKYPKQIKEAKQYIEISEKVPKYVVMYAADWCPHCKVLKPWFSEVARQQSNLSVPAYIVDDTVVSELKPKHSKLFTGVDGWPSVGIVTFGVFKMMKEGQAMPKTSINPMITAMENKAIEDKTQKELNDIFETAKRQQ